MMRKSFVLLLLVCFLTCSMLVSAAAQDDAKPAAGTPAAAPAAAAMPADIAPEPNTKASGRVEAAGTVLDEIQAAPDQRIPQEILGSAECVAVVPSLLNAGFVFGARYGRGVASCRTPKGWSAPAFFTIGGGSFGLQIGGQATDVIMLIMNKHGMDDLLSSKFKLGGDASAAAGPVGRHAAADTDWKMRAEVLTYSRSRGLFAGLELNGAVIKQDKDSTRDFYGRMVPFKTSLKGDVEAPKDAYPFLSTLAKWAQEAAK
jgi:SH3 domain-containing YSC84-like protein 1